jgi:subtilase family serine protease
VAIVDAYSDPDALSNLSTYRSQWDLEPVCSGRATSGCITFTQESQRGTSPNVGWSEEISVDLDMVSAICPKCNILLVEASSPTFASLGTAENTAATGVVSIGNSYAGGESSADIGYNTSYHSHPGITITAATGDSGYAGGVGYPAASPDVIAVGGPPSLR